MFACKNFFSFVENSLWHGTFMCYRLLRISASHQVWTHIVIVPCVVSCMFYPLSHSAAWYVRVNKDIFEWNKSNYKKKNG